VKGAVKDVALNIFHIYRNTPLGRETLLQAADFTKKVGGTLNVYVSEFDRLLLHFGPNAIEIRLDKSYLFAPESSEKKLKENLDAIGVKADRVSIKSQPASNLPRLSSNFDIVSLPRVMVEQQGRLNLAAVGSGVRQLVKHSHAPAIIAPGRFHDWSDILVLFGGSAYSVAALKWGVELAKQTTLPLRVLTIVEKGKGREDYEMILRKEVGDGTAASQCKFMESSTKTSLLDEIERSSLVVMGAYGHGQIRSRFFGSTTELVQRNTANLIMLIGQNCRLPDINRRS